MISLFTLIFSIHPRFKHDVGYRLSRAGLAVAYGKQIEFQGPIVQNVTYTTGASTLTITYTAVTNIELRSPHGFEVCFLFLCVDSLFSFMTCFIFFPP